MEEEYPVKLDFFTVGKLNGFPVELREF